MLWGRVSLQLPRTLVTSLGGKNWVLLVQILSTAGALSWAAAGAILAWHC